MNRQAVGQDDSVVESLVGQIADEFAERLERGERPEIESYARQHPQIASLLERVLPTIELMYAVPIGSCSSDLEPAAGSRFTLTGVLDDYRIVREIGRGGMGVVYEAEQISLGRRVALKVLPWAAVLDPRQLQRFHNEARAAAALHHANIVPVYAVGCDNGVHYFTMQYIEGCTLAEAIAQLSDAAPPSPAADTQPVAAISTLRPGDHGTWLRTAAQLGMQIAETLDYAHEQGVVHRDIKPSNLLLDCTGKVWVTDFGLAQIDAGSGLTMTGDLLGTLRYMSPEQTLGKRGRVDHRADVYSLGITLYELLTLQPAFPDNDRQRLMRAVVGEEPRRPRQINPAIARDLETIVLKAIGKEPSERYSSARELAEDLQRFLEIKPIRARRPTLLEQLYKWARRHIRLVVTAVAVLLVLLMAFVVATGLVLQEKLEVERARGQAEAALTEAREQSERADQERRAAQVLSVNLALDRGLTLCERGEIGQGLLWLARALEVAPEDQQDMQRLVRINLAGWSGRLLSLENLVPLSDAGPIAVAAFSTDGRYVAAGDQHGNVRVRDLESGQWLGPGLPHPAEVTALAVGPKGSVLTGCDDRQVRHWDPTAGTLIGPSLRHVNTVTAVAFSPDGQTLLTGSRDRTARLWQTSTGEPIGPLLKQEHPVLSAAFSPDGRLALTSARDRGRLWDTGTGAPAGSELRGKGLQMLAMAVSHDGRRVLSGLANRAALWDVAGGEMIDESPQHGGAVSAVAFGPNDKLLLTGSHDRTARLWDADTRRPIGQPLEHRDVVLAIGFHEDGRRVLTASEAATAHIWRIPSPTEPHPPLLHPQTVDLTALSADGRRLLTVCSSRTTVRLWDLETGELMVEFPNGGPIRQLALHPSGKIALTGTQQGGLQRWTLAGGQLGNPVHEPQHAQSVMAISGDGRTVLLSGDAEKARLYDAASGAPLGAELDVAGPVECIALSPDGSSLITGGPERLAMLWDLAGGQRLGEPLVHAAPVQAVSFTDSNKVATACRTGRVWLWDARSGELLEEGLHTRREPKSLAFSPDGRTVLAVYGDGTARLLDVISGRPLGPPLEHYGPMSAVSFSADGQRLVTSHRQISPQLAAVPQPLPGDVDRIRLWVETITGLKLDRHDAVDLLDAASWRQRQLQLQRRQPAGMQQNMPGGSPLEPAITQR